MTLRYVRSTDGNNADGGSTWLLAKASFSGAAAIAAAGDTVYPSQVHAESTAGAVSLSWAGTDASPIKIVCANDAAEPPTAVSTAATVTTTGANSITMGGGSIYCYGPTFNAGTGASAAHIALGVAALRQVYESCNFKLVNTSLSSRVKVGNNNADAAVTLINCGFKFANANQAIALSGNVHIIGGSILAGGSAPNVIFDFNTVGGANVLVTGFDFSNGATAMDVAQVNPGNQNVILRDCRMPPSWSGNLISAGAWPVSQGVFEMHNCDSGDTHYRYRRETQYGKIRDETTIVRTGGASDGTVALSWKMQTDSTNFVGPEFPFSALISGESQKYNATVGTPVTVTQEFLHDSLTNLKNDEIYLRVVYLGTSGVPLGSIVVNSKADILATGVDQTTSSASWTTTGLTNPNKQKLSATITPQEEGYFVTSVLLVKPNKTVYVCPKLVLS